MDKPSINRKSCKTRSLTKDDNIVYIMDNYAYKSKLFRANLKGFIEGWAYTNICWILLIAFGVVSL